MAKKKIKVRTTHMIDNEWYPVGKYDYHECCDCSLVHRVELKWDNGKLWEKWIRDDTQTQVAREKQRVK